MPEEKNISEDITLLNTFVNRSRGSVVNTDGGFLKTISNRLSRSSVISEPLLKNYKGGSISINDVFDLASGTIVQDNLQTFRSMSSNRYRQYECYEQMAQDPIISSALDMYADDATQTDANGDRIWTDSENPNIASITDGILNMTNLRDKIWKIARLLAEYGDVYIELLYDDEDTSKVKLLENSDNLESKEIRSKGFKDVREAMNLTLVNSKGHILKDIRIVPDIENMFDLQINGKTVAFARLIESARNSSITGYITPNIDGNVLYYPTDRFVHFYLDQSDSRSTEQYVANCNDGGFLKFDVIRGKSMIHDLYTTWRDLQLLEYSIMLNRASKSTIFRFVEVEVGNMSKSNVDATLRKVKNLIESKLTMNTETGTYKPYQDPGPIENYLYIPVRNGQGAISVNTVGGDVNIRDLADLEFYQNKLFAGLKIPKEFLNYGSDSALFNSGAALTKLDARYARTEKRLQFFIVRGSHRVLDLFLINKGMQDYISQYEIKMVVPATVEDNDRVENFKQKIELANDITSIIQGLAESENIKFNTKEYIDYLSDSVFGDSFLTRVLTVVEDSTSSNDNSTDMDIRPGETSGADFDFGGVDFTPPSDQSNNSSKTPYSAEISGNSQMSDYSGEWEDLE